MISRFNCLADWLHWLETQIPIGRINLSLDSILPIAQQLQLIDFDIPSVLIAGTNGKGSTVAFLEAIYHGSGYRTAAFTSPHFIDFNERLKINNQALPDSSWCEAFDAIDRARGTKVLSYFEFTTLAGLWIMRQLQSHLDILILEVGLGGRLDAMNVVNPDVSVITTIELDHMDYLGDTRSAIAAEKAGIMRSNKPVVCGDFDPPEIIFEIAKGLNAPLYCQNKTFSYHHQITGWQWRNDDVVIDHLPEPNLPIQNASTALQVVSLLQQRLPVAADLIKFGLKMATVTGRMQVLLDLPEVIADVAHNPHAARYLAEHLPKFRRNSGRLFAVVGMKIDKDIAQTLAVMKPLVDRWYVASLSGPRAATAAQLMIHLQDCEAVGFDSVKQAYLQALTDASEDDTIVVFGSFCTVGPILEIESEQTATTA